MDKVIYIICFLILFRYVFVLTKYLKTGEFKKKVYKGNILGIIAYSFLTLLIIGFLILMVLVDKNKQNDLVMWIIFVSALGTVLMYPWFWKQRIYDNARSKNIEINKKMNEEFISKYGDNEYDKFKIGLFNIPNDVIIDEKFNTLISIMTNAQISFVHPKEYKNVADVFAFLYQRDYIKLLMWNDSINLICEKVNSLLKNNNLELEIKQEEIKKDDDNFVKERRNNLIPTLAYDLNKINEIIKQSLHEYELVGAIIFSKENNIKYPTYLCVVKTSEYNRFFNINNNETEDTKNEQ